MGKRTKKKKAIKSLIKRMSKLERQFAMLVQAMYEQNSQLSERNSALLRKLGVSNKSE